MEPRTAIQTQSITIDDVRRAARRLRGVALRTPILRQPGFEAQSGGEVYLKAECLQRTGSFKFRGAYNTLATMLEGERPLQVITSSSGNHGQALAAAGKLLGIPVTVVMPSNAVEVKVEAVKRYGGRVEVAGTTSVEREARAREVGASEGGVVIGSFDDARIIAGQGTAGLELSEDLAELDLVLVPVGGGGLISGIATAVKAFSPSTRVVGVEPAGAADASQSLQEGRIVTLERIDTVADGLRTSRIGRLNFEIMRGLLDGIVLVDDEEILEAMQSLALSSKLVVEPSGAVAVAALLSGKVQASGRVAAVISGGNVDPTLLSRVLTDGR